MKSTTRDVPLRRPRPATVARPPRVAAPDRLRRGRPVVVHRLRPGGPVRPAGAARPVLVRVPLPQIRAAALRGRAPRRLTPLGRRSVVLLAVAMITLTFLAGRALSSSPPGPDQRTTTVAVVVKPGDTLWSIARAAVPSRDPRVTVEQIRRTNHLSVVRVLPGQRLLVPR